MGPTGFLHQRIGPASFAQDMLSGSRSGEEAFPAYGVPDAIEGGIDLRRGACRDSNGHPRRRHRVDARYGAVELPAQN